MDAIKATINNIEEFVDDIQKDAHKYATNIAKYMAQDIADEMREVAYNAIENFYSEYDPEDSSKHNGHIYYYRNWNFRKSFKRYYKNRDPYFVGGVELLEDEVPNVYTGTNSSPSSVFWRVYSGLHGIASLQSKKGSISTYVPIMTPSPHAEILLKYQYIRTHLKDYEDKAAIKARRDSYKYIF